MIKAVQKYIDSAKEEVEIIETINKKSGKECWAPILKECFDHKGNYVIITSLHGMSLFRLLEINHKGFPIHIIRKMTKELLLALNHIHRFGLVHTDLKVI